MKIRKCRVWWPRCLSSSPTQPSAFLYGWILSSSSTSIDIVVAFISEEASFSSTLSNLQGILHETNGNMPVFLQDKCMFSMLGYSAADSGCNGQLNETEEYNKIDSSMKEKHEQWACGCHKQFRYASNENGTWLKFVYSFEHFAGKLQWIPKLHHIHWDAQTLFNLDLHVIVYETPRFGSHHFSLGSPHSLDLVKTHFKKPKWVEELHLKPPLLDMDSIVLAINCGAAAKSFFEELVVPKRCTTHSRIMFMFSTFTWQLFAMSVASISTLYYVFIRFFHTLLTCGSKSCMCLALERLFNHTWKNIRIHSCQILYWPIFLQNAGLRSESCVEYAERSAIQRHFTWSNMAVDILLGNLVGITLLFNAELACSWLSNISNDITNNLLRMGCVRLMGNPAGFKLNTELAGVLGLISLNAIQVWSTLWFFLGPFFVYFIEGLALSGVILGLTTPAALVIDMISLATLHVSTLHWFISLLYSNQILAITALWRLFRGQKLNPLRQRLDSYSYTVEQHIIGSLLFTPLLLVLPTTCAFYIFFTIMNRSIGFICIVIEVSISIIHATPYAKIFLWLVSAKRFPCGIWFENIIISSETRIVDTSGSGFGVLISFLHSNSLNIRQLVWPHYKCIYSVFTRSYLVSSAYGALTGRSVPSSPEYHNNLASVGINGLPSKTQWMMSITYKEYWRLCRDALLTCKS